MNSERWVFRAWHSDSTMATRAGLMRKPLISVCRHFDSFNVAPLLCLVSYDIFIELLDGVRRQCKDSFISAGSEEPTHRAALDAMLPLRRG
jgi:hypothetical protein